MDTSVYNSIKYKRLIPPMGVGARGELIESGTKESIASTKNIKGSD